MSDSVNNAYGSSSTSSICGTTSVALSGGSWSSYLTVSTSAGYPVMKFLTSSASLVGTHTPITVYYYLTSYTYV